MIALPTVRGSLSGFSPLALQPALWLDAADAATMFDATSGGNLVAAGGSIARWADKSGNARHVINATSGARPLRITAALAGRDVVRFDGLDDFLAVADCGVHSRVPFTAVCVHQFITLSMSTSGGWEMLCGHNVDNSTGPTGVAQIQRRERTHEIGAHNAVVANVGVFANTGSGGLLQARVTMLRRAGGNALGNGATLTVRSNAITATGTQTWDTSHSGTRYQIGGRMQANFVSWCNADVAEVILMPRAIMDSEANRLFTHLAIKWAIPIN